MNDGRVEGPIVPVECVVCGLQLDLRLVRHYRPWPPIDTNDYLRFKEHAFDGVEEADPSWMCPDCLQRGYSLEMYGVKKDEILSVEFI